MKRFSIILGFIGAVVCWGNAFATAPVMPSTVCPMTFTCAFDAAEVRPLTDPTTPGAPAVYVGYLSFNGSGVPTLDALGTTNGTLQTLVTAVGTCTPGDATKMGVLNFQTNGGPTFEFVSDDGGLELRVMIVADSGNVTPSAVNIGTCTQQ
jgi:hypothetical protein